MVIPAAASAVMIATRSLGARGSAAGCSPRVTGPFAGAAEACAMPCKCEGMAASTAAGVASPYVLTTQ
eukprot:11188745-Lingulodinium_polyedra.AAC.1